VRNPTAAELDEVRLVASRVQTAQLEQKTLLNRLGALCEVDGVHLDILRGVWVNGQGEPVIK
jgi:hypothetical protein